MSYPPTGSAGAPLPGDAPYPSGGNPGYSLPDNPPYGEQHAAGGSYPGDHAQSPYTPGSAPVSSGAAPVGGYPQPGYEHGQAAVPGYGQPGQAVTPGYEQPGQAVTPGYEQPGQAPGQGHGQPGYGQTAPGYGQPSAGPGDTAVQPAYPGGQMSAPPYGTPLSAPPGSGVPYGTPVASPGGARKGRAVLVLGLVAGLLFVLGGLMTGLFVAKSGELTKTERNLTAQVADRDSKIDANGKEIDRLKRELQAANDKVKAVEQDLTGTKNDRDEQERQKQIIAKCLDLFAKAMAATNSSSFETAIRAADKACSEADKYL